MSLPILSPMQAMRLIEDGALLVDIREPDEHAREKIPGARLVPLANLGSGAIAAPAGKPVLFHCRSGARTRSAAARLSAAAGSACAVYIVDGGLDAWKQAGLPVTIDRRQPLELQRQVQIGAGTMALGGTLLGVFVSPWLYIVPGFVGAGLLVAGLTGFCGMARILMKAPWNRATYAA